MKFAFVVAVAKFKFSPEVLYCACSMKTRKRKKILHFKIVNLFARNVVVSHKNEFQ